METGAILSGLLGGIALFLYGMDRMTGSLNSVAGARMQKLLASATSSPIRGALTGAGLTAILQSSSLTTVLCVGFISAGLMNLRQAVGVIIGANVGTTVTAQIIALDVAHIALPMITVGVALRFLAKTGWQKHLGSVILGVGLVFYGMELMASATAPLRTFAPFVDFMRSFSHPWVGILAGACFTALVQSSSATTGLVIVLGSQSIISLEAAIALVIGANVGSCVTAGVAASGRGAQARQAAAVHVLFNVVGALVWWILIQPLAHLTVYLSGPDVARQIANAHTIFNVSNAAVALGLTGQLARLVERIIPVSKPTGASLEPLYLDPAYLAVPSMALERVKLELIHLGTRSLEAFRRVGQDESVLDQLPALTRIQDAIVDYLRHISREEMTPFQSHRFQSALVIADALESVGTAVTELLEFERGLGEKPFLTELKDFHEMVAKSLEQAVASIENPELAEVVRDRKSEVRACRDESLGIASEHLLSDRPGVAERYRHRAGVIDEIRRVYYLACRICRAVQKLEAERRESGPPD
jgi:phosphate:Na+ symporter